MCDLHDHHGLPPLPADEYVLDTPSCGSSWQPFGSTSPRRRAQRRRARRSARPSRMPADATGCRRSSSATCPTAAWVAESGNGCCFARPTARSASSASSCRRARRRRSTTTSPGGSSGSIAALRTRSSTGRDGSIELTRRRPLTPGDYYVLLPPADDVHRVRTTSAETSVSIHLLANDTGCTDRHTFDELTGSASPFRSGYANADCENVGANRA